MINTEVVYRRSVAILKDGGKALADERKKLESTGRKPEEIRRVLSPTKAYLTDIAYEVRWYENAKKGKIPPMEELAMMGRTLVALRIASGMSQEQLARKMGVTQPQVSRDENDGYRGITIERAQRIMSVFGAKFQSKVILTPAGRQTAA